MGFGGGGGGNDLEEQERARQARIDDTVRQINASFGSPQLQSEYGQLQQATQGRLEADLTRDADKASRELRFALARAGQLGGSVDADAYGELGRRVDEQGINAAVTAQGAANQLRQADLRSRADLTGLAQSGLGAEAALSQSLASLESNRAAAQTASQQATLGNLVSGIGDITDVYGTRRAQQRARSDFRPSGSNPRPGTGGVSGSTS